MASEAKRLPGNVPGPLFVDSTCIDCDTCRLLDPAIYLEQAGQSVVQAQPATEAAWTHALRALVACPTSSIGLRAPDGPAGDAARRGLASARDAFPEAIDPEVGFCGYTSADSFGAWSYLLRRPDGNVLIDSPRWAEPLARRIAALGGVRWLFLTHRDDVADHARWAAHFGAERILHADDVSPDTRVCERILTGTEPHALARDLLVIPTPGHTRGHAVLLHAGRHLFTGDHLAWDSGERRLIAFRNACWYDWEVQSESMRRLLGHEFEWVLPGHGERVQLDRPTMRRELEGCVSWMEGKPRPVVS